MSADRYTFRLTNLDPDGWDAMYRTFSTLVEVQDLGLLHAPLRSILTELTNNALKANLKRVFFSHRANEPQDYDSLMEEFRETIASRQNELFVLANEAQLSATVRFDTEDSGLRLRVENSTPMLEREVSVVRELLGEQRSTAREAEGGGLGLAMLVRMLANIGLGSECLSFESNESGTRFECRIPRLARPEQMPGDDTLATHLAALRPQLKNPLIPAKTALWDRMLDEPGLFALLITGLDAGARAEIGDEPERVLEQARVPPPPESEGDLLAHGLPDLRSLEQWARSLYGDRLTKRQSARLGAAVRLYSSGHSLAAGLTEEVSALLREISGRQAPRRPVSALFSLGWSSGNLARLWALGQHLGADWLHLFPGHGPRPAEDQQVAALVQYAHCLFQARETRPGRRYNWKLMIDTKIARGEHDESLGQRVLAFAAGSPDKEPEVTHG